MIAAQDKTLEYANHISMVEGTLDTCPYLPAVVVARPRAVFRVSCNTRHGLADQPFILVKMKDDMDPQRHASPFAAGRAGYARGTVCVDDVPLRVR